MKIALACATHRGLLCLRKLVELRPQDSMTVFSFREEPNEPAFFDAIRQQASDSGAEFAEARALGAASLRRFWEDRHDILLAVSWRYMIPRELCLRPHRGTFVFHDSLLPEYRGFAPTVWAIANGEDHTGATLFRANSAVDSGDIVDQRRVPIGAEDTICQVMNGVTEAYLKLLESNLDALLSGTARCTPQDNSLATFTCKRTPDDNQIDWSWPAERIYNLIRATTRPYGGAYTTLAGRTVRVWSAERLPDYPRYAGAVPGRIVALEVGRGAVALTGDGALLLKEVRVDTPTPPSEAAPLLKIHATLGR